MPKADHCVLDSDRIAAAEAAGDEPEAAYWRAYHAWHTREANLKADAKVSRARKAKWSTRRGTFLGSGRR